MIYFDNAATSWPKVPGVGDAMLDFLTNIGANPGRSGHRMAVESGRIVYNTREAVAKLFNASDPLQVVFGHNVTEALNLALNGLLRPGDHVITSSMEHNSMMRPIRALQKKGVLVTVVQCSTEGFMDLEDLRAEIKPTTKMIALNHASNIIGTLLPIPDVGQIAREHDLLFLVDAAQTGGAYPINMQENCIDLLGFTGHKSLYGPMGTGGLIIGERVNVKNMEPLKRGGTGSRSESEIQPDFLPDLAESGTPNAVGLAGLNASIEWILEKGVDNIRAHEMGLTQQLIDGLLTIPKVKVYGGLKAIEQTATVSFNVLDREPSDVGVLLDEEFDIMCRVGLHCSPVSHKTIGTFPDGTIRFGLGLLNTADEIEKAISAVRQISTTVDEYIPSFSLSKQHKKKAIS
jgi:cysteine desulfurase family protein